MSWNQGGVPQIRSIQQVTLDTSNLQIVQTILIPITSAFYFVLQPCMSVTVTEDVNNPGGVIFTTPSTSMCGVVIAFDTAGKKTTNIAISSDRPDT